MSKKSSRDIEDSRRELRKELPVPCRIVEHAPCASVFLGLIILLLGTACAPVYSAGYPGIPAEASISMIDERKKELAQSEVEKKAFKAEVNSLPLGSILPTIKAKNPVIKVFYGTTRSPSGSNEFNAHYGGLRIQKPAPLNIGTVSVSIPPDHHKGKVEEPFSIFSVQLKEVAEKHVMLVGLKELPPDKFYLDLRNAIDNHSGAAFVFVHGYNVTFADAARRTAQIANDLHAGAVPILFSWASQGSVLAYFDDDAAARDAVDYLRDFLWEISARTGASTIHLIAHSMGNEVLTQALKGLAGKPAPNGKIAHYEQVVLAAPDVDGGVFYSAVEELKKISKRVTHYVSSKDWALKVSHAFRWRSFRAGDSEPTPILIQGVDTIDVSSVSDDWLGHNYVTSNRSVLSDIFSVLDGKPVKDRFGIKEVSKQGKSYYSFEP